MSTVTLTWALLAALLRGRGGGRQRGLAHGAGRAAEGAGLGLEEAEAALLASAALQVQEVARLAARCSRRVTVTHRADRDSRLHSSADRAPGATVTPPAGQGRQASCPSAGWYSPEAQARHERLCGSQTLPGAHGTQAAPTDTSPRLQRNSCSSRKERSSGRPFGSSWKRRPVRIGRSKREFGPRTGQTKGSRARPLTLSRLSRSRLSTSVRNTCSGSSSCPPGPCTACCRTGMSSRTLNMSWPAV